MHFFLNTKVLNHWIMKILHETYDILDITSGAYDITVDITSGTYDVTEIFSLSFLTILRFIGDCTYWFINCLSITSCKRHTCTFI
jgi:hypothetical protein